MRESYRQIVCRFCSGTQSKVILTQPKFVIRACPHCEVLWCDPLRFDETFKKSNEGAYLATSHIALKTNRKKVSALIKHAPPERFPKLLEIGCMHGDFLLQTKSHGYDVKGFDLSESAISLANKRFAGLAEVGTLDGSFPSDSINVVAAFNVIEHMDYPDKFLDEVKRVLVPGGYLFLETPSKESLYHYVMFFIAGMSSKEKAEIGLGPGGHIYKFGKKAWNIILSEKSFQNLLLYLNLPDPSHTHKAHWKFSLMKPYIHSLPLMLLLLQKSRPSSLLSYRF